jgi:hypothetical protein
MKTFFRALIVPSYQMSFSWKMSAPTRVAGSANQKSLQLAILLLHLSVLMLM